jgi:hypothetical protein
MQSDIGFEMRDLTEHELDAISGAKAWDAARMTALLIERTAAHGIALFVDIADAAVASYAGQT